MSRTIKIEFTAIQAKVLWQTVDGAADAGSCEGGCTKQELQALGSIADKLLKQREAWMSVKLVSA